MDEAVSFFVVAVVRIVDAAAGSSVVGTVHFSIVMNGYATMKSVVLLICGIVAVACQLLTELDSILGPSFGPIPNSAVESGNSLTTTNERYVLVDRPQQTYINDTAVTILWNYNGASSGSGFPRAFIIELAYGGNNLDFSEIAEIDNPIPDTISSGTFQSSYTVSGLLPQSTYSVRVKPVFLVNGAGFPSLVFTFETLRSPVNYWEAILPRRTSKQAFGRGFGGPLSTRPLLDEGVEVFGQRTHESNLWYSDAPTDQIRVFPSGRRGHSWTFVDGKVYMFGGRTNGYSCANTVMNTMDLGSLDSGVMNYPCTIEAAEVSEIWSYDVNTFIWEQLNATTLPGVSPGPREQHNAVAIGNEIYYFGGKSRRRSLDTISTTSFTSINNDITKNDPYRVYDEVYNDLWKLVLDREVKNKFPCLSLPATLTQTSRLSLVINPPVPTYYPNKPNITYATASGIDGNISPFVDHPRQGYCIQDVTIEVTFSHPCLSQVQMSITGPGPQSASSNYFASGSDLNIRLLNAGVTNIPAVDSTVGQSCFGGTHTFVFNDAFTNEYLDVKNPSEPNAEMRPTDFFYLKPAGQLAHFVGHSPLTNWTLIIEDTNNDALLGTVYNYSISFKTRKCFPQFQWVNLSSSVTADGSKPPARYAALSMAYERSIFVFGGRDKYDQSLTDLFRFDVDTNSWVQLTPAGDFYSSGVYMARAGGSAGANYMLTSWGMFRFAGYFRNPIQSLQNNGVEQQSNYDNRIYLLDPVTMRWEEIPVSLVNNTPANAQLTGLMNIPIPRYLAGATFLPASAFKWHTNHFLTALQNAPGASAASIDRVLYDSPVMSLQGNFQSSVADSVLIFGGFDGVSGMLDDGSSGGLLNDLYLLRLNTLSTQGARVQKETYRRTHCRWRTTETAVTRDNTYSCLVNSSTGSAAAPCKFRDLLMMSWCVGDNQSMR